MKKIKKILKILLKNKENRKVTIIVLSLLLIFIGYVFYLKKSDRVLIENSLINTPVISISPDIPGKIIETYVVSDTKVKKGDALALVGTQTLKAYTDGLIVSVNNAKGASVNSQTPVIQMVDLSTMRVDGTIDENKGLSKLKIGQIASFTIDAYPNKTYWGYVDEISSTAKQTQLAYSISSSRPIQQFDIFVKFDPNLYPEIKNGMSARITIYTK